MSNFEKETENTEKFIVSHTLIILCLISSYIYYSIYINFSSESFGTHFIGLSLIMGGFFSLATIAFGSLVTGSGKLFFLNKFSFFIPIFSILLIGYLIVMLGYPYIFKLETFTFWNKFGLYIASYVAGAFYLTTLTNGIKKIK